MAVPVEITLLSCSFVFFLMTLPCASRRPTQSSDNNIPNNTSFYSGKRDLTFKFLSPSWKDKMNLTQRCEEIRVPICKDKDVGYTETFLPNIFQDRSQHEAGLSLKSFHLLLDINCSPHLRRFLCLLYLPICGVPFSRKPILPCRHLCSVVQKDCNRILNIFRLSWPSEINCGTFPESGLCVGPPIDSLTVNSTIGTILDYFPKKKLLIPEDKRKKNISNILKVSPKLITNNNIKKIKIYELFCIDFIHIISWVKPFSMLCFLSTSLSIYIFCTGSMKHFQFYPERAFVWMLRSYMLMSIAFIVECFSFSLNSVQDKMAPSLPGTANKANYFNNTPLNLTQTTAYFFSDISVFNSSTTKWQHLSKIPTKTFNSNNTNNHILPGLQDEPREYISYIVFVVIRTFSMMSGNLWWTMTSISSFFFAAHGRNYFVKAKCVVFHTFLWGTSALFAMFVLVILTAKPFGTCSWLISLNTFHPLGCMFFFLLFKLKEWLLIQYMEPRIIRNWNQKLRLFSEILFCAFMGVALCHLSELAINNNNNHFIDCTPTTNLTHNKTCFHNYNNNDNANTNDYTRQDYNNILIVKYFMIFFPGITSGFLCMALTCTKKQYHYECCSNDDDDNEEIHL